MADGFLHETGEVLRVAVQGHPWRDTPELAVVRGHFGVEVQLCGAGFGVTLEHGHAGVIARRLDGERYDAAVLCLLTRPCLILTS
jgi:hypothetical protein